MSDLMVIQAAKLQKTETDVAVLQVQLKNVEDKVDEIKVDMKAASVLVDSNHEATHRLIDELHQDIKEEFKALGKRVGALEKWRWTLVGGGAVLGALGIEFLQKYLK